MESLFSRTGYGYHFDLKVSLPKLFTKLGSLKSLEFLNKLAIQGEKRLSLYENELVQRFIEFKEQQLTGWSALRIGF